MDELSLETGEIQLHRPKFWREVTSVFTPSPIRNRSPRESEGWQRWMEDGFFDRTSVETSTLRCLQRPGAESKSAPCRAQNRNVRPAGRRIGRCALPGALTKNKKPRGR